MGLINKESIVRYFRLGLSKFLSESHKDAMRQMVETLGKEMLLCEEKEILKKHLKKKNSAMEITNGTN